jgi:hypothetical protein
VHQGTNIIKHVKAFLGQKKKKDKGKTCFHVNIWKHHDATLFGAEKAWVSPSPLHLPEVKKFLLSFKKERKHAKVMGNLDKENADPVPWPLFVQICHCLSGCVLSCSGTAMDKVCQLTLMGFTTFCQELIQLLFSATTARLAKKGQR